LHTIYMNKLEFSRVRVGPINLSRRTTSCTATCLMLCAKGVLDELDTRQHPKLARMYVIRGVVRRSRHLELLRNIRGGRRRCSCIRGPPRGVCFEIFENKRIKFPSSFSFYSFSSCFFFFFHSLYRIFFLSFE
jgi:hypothetical protein